MTFPTQAFVFGAGLGTRFRPLTEDIPKPLVPIFQKPLITFAFDHLIAAGTKEFIVNTHHRPERFTETFSGNSYRGCSITFRHEPDLLETGGGIANIADLLGKDDPLLVYNGDILTDLPLAPLVQAHRAGGNVATLALRSSGGPQHIALDRETGRIRDIRNQLLTNVATEFVFSGIYLVEPAFIKLLEPGVKRSVIPTFLEMIRRQEKLGGVVIDDGQWWDVGNRDAYLQLHRDLPGLAFPSFAVGDPDWRARIHASARVEPNALLTGCTVLGANCVVESGSTLDDTVVWPGSQIASRSHLESCIVRSQRRVEGTHRNADL